MAGGANVILIPENPFDVDAVVAHCQHRFDSGYSPIIVVSEGAKPKDGDLIARRRGRRTRSGTCGSAASARRWPR